MTLLWLLEDLVRTHLIGDNAWVNTLLTQRRIVAIPLTNPWGYDRVVRHENNMDPNRDFPYDTQASQCMRTTAARAVNEVWRRHIFMGGLTFHGGMQAIAYEWGSFNHRTASSESPDDAAQRAIALVMREAAGRFGGQKYPADRMNNLVYPVNGGMEDWAYAGSWEPQSVPVCKPSTYDGYPEERTRYSDAMLRAFNVLIETADDKRPAEGTLGAQAAWPAETPDSSNTNNVSSSDVLSSVLSVEGPGDGHVPRNLRLALSFIDLLSPYVETTAMHAAVVKANGPNMRSATASGSQSADGSCGASSRGARALEARSEGSAVNGDAARAMQASLAPSPTPWPMRTTSTQALVEAPFTGPGTCTAVVRAASTADASTGTTNVNPSTGTGTGSAPSSPSSCGTGHKGQYDQWIVVDSTQPAAPSKRSAMDIADVINEATAAAAAAAAQGAGAGSSRSQQQPLIAPVSANDAVGVWVAWDVGGAVTVDATSALIGTWDMRVPPALLTQAYVIPTGKEVEPVTHPTARVLTGQQSGSTDNGMSTGSSDNVDPNPTGTHSNLRKAAATRPYAPSGVPSISRTELEEQLETSYGLSPIEASSLARQVVVWQQVLLGQLAIDAVPADMLVRHAVPGMGLTRWTFGELGAQAPERNDTAFVGAWSADLPTGAALNAQSASSSSPVLDAPNLSARPFTARYSECFLLPLPKPGTSFNASSAQGDSTVNSVVATQAYIILPYAIVDTAWKQQGNPDPSNVPPQSHWVNSRSNPQWHFENGGYTVQGRRHAAGEPRFVALVHRQPVLTAVPSTGRLLDTMDASGDRYTCNDGKACPVASSGARMQLYAGAPANSLAQAATVAPEDGAHSPITVVAISALVGMLLTVAGYLVVQRLRARAQRHVRYVPVDMPTGSAGSGRGGSTHRGGKAVAV